MNMAAIPALIVFGIVVIATIVLIGLHIRDYIRKDMPVCWVPGCGKMGAIVMADSYGNIQHWCKPHAIEERDNRG